MIKVFLCFSLTCQKPKCLSFDLHLCQSTITEKLFCILFHRTIYDNEIAKIVSIVIKYNTHTKPQNNNNNVIEAKQYTEFIITIIPRNFLYRKERLIWIFYENRTIKIFAFFYYFCAFCIVNLMFLRICIVLSYISIIHYN